MPKTVINDEQEECQSPGKHLSIRKYSLQQCRESKDQFPQEEKAEANRIHRPDADFSRWNGAFRPEFSIEILVEGIVEKHSSGIKARQCREHRRQDRQIGRASCRK